LTYLEYLSCAIIDYIKISMVSSGKLIAYFM